MSWEEFLFGRPEPDGCERLGWDCCRRRMLDRGSKVMELFRTLTRCEKIFDTYLEQSPLHRL